MDAMFYLDKLYDVGYGAFSRRFDLGRFQGQAVIMVTAHSGNQSIHRFNNDQAAREYFEQYTTPIVEQKDLTSHEVATHGNRA